MEREQQLDPHIPGRGRSRPEEGGGGDSATCTGVVTAAARPGPPSPAHGEPGLQPQGEVLPKVSPCGTGSPIRGLGHRPRAVITGTSAEPGSGGRRNNPVLPVHPSPSHRPAVLDATLGRNARPGQEAAEEALGLSVYPLGNGARAQAG